jgi:outer membrane lipoprotein-sorting protein
MHAFRSPLRSLLAGGIVLLAALALPAQAQNQPIDLTGGAALKKDSGKAKAGAPDPQSTQAIALTPQQIVQRANAYFNGMDSFAGDFVQTNEDGRRYKGKLIVVRPGKMRFDYAPPARILILSDGSTVAVVDERLRTKDRYPIGQTPLKFLLQDQINLSRDTRLVRAKVDQDAASITIEDKTTFGGTSRITMLFEPETFTLQGWRVTDGQGTTTEVAVTNLKRGVKVADKAFEITNEDLLLKLQSGGRK